MATTLTGGNGTDVILPEGVTTDQVGVTSTADGETLSCHQGKDLRH